MRCLIVVDVQNGFVTSETKHVVPKIVDLVSKFEGTVICSKFVNIVGSPYCEYMDWHALFDSPDIDLLEEIEDKSDVIIEKNIYTALDRKLEGFLIKNGILEVYIVGINTDCCVLKTAVDLFESGVKPIVLADYCASTGGVESHEAGLKVLERLIGYKQIVYGEYEGER